MKICYSGFLRLAKRDATWCEDARRPFTVQEVLMPGTQPIDRDVLTGFRLGDERALEQVFRARFERNNDAPVENFSERAGILANLRTFGHRQSTRKSLSCSLRGPAAAP